MTFNVGLYFVFVNYYMYPICNNTLFVIFCFRRIYPQSSLSISTGRKTKITARIKFQYGHRSCDDAHLLTPLRNTKHLHLSNLGSWVQANSYKTRSYTMDAPKPDNPSRTSNINNWIKKKKTKQTLLLNSL